MVIAPELIATILTLMLPLPLSDGSRVRHLLRFTRRIALMMDFLGGRFGPLFAGARPRGSELREGVFPRLIPANRLAASLPRDLEGDDFVFLGAVGKATPALEFLPRRHPNIFMLAGEFKASHVLRGRCSNKAIAILNLFEHYLRLAFSVRSLLGIASKGRLLR